MSRFSTVILVDSLRTKHFRHQKVISCVVTFQHVQHHLVESAKKSGFLHGARKRHNSPLQAVSSFKGTGSWTVL